MASSAIFIGVEFCGLQGMNAKSKIEHGSGLRAATNLQNLSETGHRALRAYFASTVKTCRPL
jgi:hypothetical protein